MVQVAITAPTSPRRFEIKLSVGVFAALSFIPLTDYAIPSLQNSNKFTIEIFLGAKDEDRCDTSRQAQMPRRVLPRGRRIPYNQVFAESQRLSLCCTERFDLIPCQSAPNGDPGRCAVPYRSPAQIG